MHHGQIVGTISLELDVNIRELLYNHPVAHIVERRSNGRPVAYIPILAVDESFRGQGIGFSLVKEALQTVSRPVLSIGWVKPDTGWMAKAIFDRLGFERIAIIDEFWYADSVIKQYGCPYCGKTWCKCTADIVLLDAARSIDH
ncbi:GNAT family N-acetyltransferase [Paenibacillus sophorae]|nr:GNAT family N-acetyltransferase [Paenibacillus sophorae]QWU16717.1 GNAT family N-acetyltransferase [Paenibacillus sophorae]